MMSSQTGINTDAVVGEENFPLLLFPFFFFIESWQEVDLGVS